MLVEFYPRESETDLIKKKKNHRENLSEPTCSYKKEN